MNIKALWALRDARGLTTTDKALTAMIISRGTAFASASTLMADAAMGRTAFYESRKRLTGLGVIRAVERPGQTTVYTADIETLRALAPLSRDDTGQQRTLPGGGTGAPAGSQHGGVPRDGIQSKNPKGNSRSTSSSAALDRVSATTAPASLSRPLHERNTTGPTGSVDSATTVVEMALQVGAKVSTAEAVAVAQTLANAIAAGLAPSTAAECLNVYLERRALPETDPSHARTSRIFSMMLDDARIGIKPVLRRSGDSSAQAALAAARPMDVRHAAHTTGGRRVSSM